MKDEILALLVAMFAGVRKDGLNQLARSMALQVSTKDEAAALVEKLTEAQVNDFVKEYRSEVDKEATEARKTYESTLKKKFDFVEKKNNEPGMGGSDLKGSGEPNDIAALVKAAIADAVSPLQAKLESYEKGDIAKSRLQSLTDKLSTCKDDNFKTQALKDFGRMKFDTDDEFSEYLTEKETAISTANQNVADVALGGQGKPLFTQKNETGISQGVAEFVASQNPDSNVLSGKEV